MDVEKMAEFEFIYYIEEGKISYDDIIDYCKFQIKDCKYQMSKNLKIEEITETLERVAGYLLYNFMENGIDKRYEISQLERAVRLIRDYFEDGFDCPKDKEMLPDELNTPSATEYFNKALSLGWMEKTETGFKWKKQKVELAYFCQRIYCPNNQGRFPETALNKLFNETRLQSALSKMYDAKNEQSWKLAIDNIFE